MKKKLLMLLLAGVLVSSNSMLVLAEESTVSPTEEGTDADTTNNTDINTDINTDTNTPGQDSINDVIPNDIQTYGNTNDTVTGKEAVDAINNETVLIIDVRTSGSYVTGHLKGSLSLPVFAAGNVIEGAEAEALWTAFSSYVQSNPGTFTGKDIYVLCNSGSRGAQKAKELLNNLGYTNVFTIVGGAKDETIQAAFITEYNFVDGVTAANEIGAADKLFLDVRGNSVYATGHLKGSLSLPVFNSVSNSVDDAEALANQTAFTNYVKTNPTTFAGKDIYILCNSGSRGAQKATQLLVDQGISQKNIFTIKGGAKDTNIKAKLTYVSADAAINAIGNKDILLLDVRAASVYAAGHLKGSLSLPVFAEGNVIEGAEAEALWASFTAYVKSNPSTFGNKAIYVLCNSGSRGAVKATELLHNEGYTNVFTIEGGAKNESIQAKFITTEQEQQANQNTGTTTDKKSYVTVATKNSVPETGDTSQTFMYLLLLAASSVILVFRKRVAR